MNLLYILSIFLCLLINHCSFAKVLIITHNYDRPQFVGWHRITFDKFLQDDYEYVVFSDARTDEMHQQIADACKKFNVQCIRIPQNLHGMTVAGRVDHPSYRHAVGIQYSLEQLGFNHNDILVIIDTDLLIIRPFSFTEYMKDTDIAAIFRRMYDLDFCWPGLTCFRMNQLPDKKAINFEPGIHNEKYMDTGWNTYFYLQSHPNLRIKSMNMLEGSQLFCDYTDHIKTPDMVRYPLHNLDLSKEQQIKALEQIGFNQKEVEFLMKKPCSVDFFHDHTFLHYRCYTNIEWLEEFINNITR